MRRPRLRAWPLLACALAGCVSGGVLAPPVACAAPAKPRKTAAKQEEEARAAVRQGLVLAGRGSPEEALVQYERAKELVPYAKMPYRYAAQVLIDLGRIEEAVANLEKYLELDPNASDAEDVRARIADLRAKLPATVSITTVPDGASVFVDGSPAAAGTTPLTGLVLPVGEHTIRAQREGFATAERKITVTSSRPFDLSIELVALPITSQAVATPPPPPPPRSSPRSPRRTIGLAAAGVGASLLATSLVFDRMVLSTREDFDKARASGDGQAISLKERGETQQTLTLVTLVAGGSFLLGGLTLALWPSSRSTFALLPNGATWRTVF